MTRPGAASSPATSPARDQINLDYGDGSDSNVGSLGTGFLNDAIARAIGSAQTQDAPPTSTVPGDPTPYTPFTTEDASAVLKHAVDTYIVPAAKAALAKKKKKKG
jgi:hypothetical protein